MQERQNFWKSMLLLGQLTIVLACLATPMMAQEGYKGEGTSKAGTGSTSGVYKRPIKKLNNTNRPAAPRGSAQAIEANKKGDEHYDAGRYDEAVEAYKQAVSLNPKYAEAFSSLGDSYQALKRYEEAISAYNQAVKLKPDFDDAYEGLGDTYLAMNMKEKSQAAYNKARSKKIVGGVLNGKALSLPVPQYPAAARAVRVSGSVNVEVTIDETGQVIRAEAVSGHPLLRDAAVTAASQARFTPTKLSGQPVKVTGIITYNFTL